MSAAERTSATGSCTSPFFPLWPSVGAHQPHHDSNSKAANSLSSLRGADAPRLPSLTGWTNEMCYVLSQLGRQTCSLQRCCSLLHLSIWKQRAEVESWTLVYQPTTYVRDHFLKLMLSWSDFISFLQIQAWLQVLFLFLYYPVHTYTLGTSCYFLVIYRSD